MQFDLTGPPEPRSPQFPYPILNQLPFPHGFACFVAAGVALVALLFQTGAMVRRALQSSTQAVATS